MSDRVKITVERMYSEASYIKVVEHWGSNSDEAALMDILASEFCGEGSDVDWTVMRALGNLAVCGTPFAFPAAKALALAILASDYEEPFEEAVRLRIDVSKLCRPGGDRAWHAKLLADIPCVELVNGPAAEEGEQ